MPQDAPPNGGARDQVPGPWSRVAGMQAKLHRWAAADPGRRFDDLFNFVHDPATLYVAYCRVAGNRGANTPGVDGMTVALVEERIGVREFLDDLRAQLKAGTFRPLPVRALARITWAEGFTASRLERNRPRSKSRWGSKSILFTTTTSAARNITGYLNGFSSPSVMA